MNRIFIKYINEFFKKLIENYGFTVKNELNEKQSYIIEYESKDFIISIEKYFREFYASLNKVNKSDDKINLFNLLDFLIHVEERKPKSDYFRKEKNIEDCYRKQLDHISSVVYENYDLLIDFFNKDNYEINISEFEKYWEGKHPELYKKR